MQVILSSEEASNMSIKLFRRTNNQRVMPAIKSLSDTNHEVHEGKAVFKLEANSAYMIEIGFRGDMFDQYGEETPCEYFDMTIAINSVRSLAQKFRCD